MAFERAINYYGFGVLPCRPAKGSDKGDVERDIRTYANRISNYVKNRGLVFKDWDAFNAFLAGYAETRQTERSKEKLKEEALFLEPLAARDDDVLCRIELTPATAYGTVRLGKSAYSVPDKAIAAPCRVVSGPYGVRIWRVGGNKECLA